MFCWSSKDFSLRVRLGDTFFVIDRGRCVAKGEMSELSDELVKQYLSV